MEYFTIENFKRQKLASEIFTESKRFYRIKRICHYWTRYHQSMASWTKNSDLQSLSTNNQDSGYMNGRRQTKQYFCGMPESSNQFESETGTGLLQREVFQIFRQFSHVNYKPNSTGYLTMLVWDAMLHENKVRLVLVIHADIFLMIKAEMKGGISVIS